jgi:diguanylate cyclase (GGDEF)-like protein
MLFQKIRGIKTLFLSLAAFFLVSFVVMKTQVFWLKQLMVIEQLLVVLLVVVIVFASYFNRSRLTFISLLWLLYYASFSFSLPWSVWLASQHDWLTMFGCFSLLFLSLIKDRGVLSTHGFYRLIALVLSGVVAYLWLQTSESVIAFVQTSLNTLQFKQYIRIEFLIVFSVLIIFWRAVKSSDLVIAAIFVSLVVWLLHQYQLINLPISLTLTLISLYYLLVIIVDAYFLAYRDDLTGLPSRRALNQLALSLGRKYIVAMLDIDHFKKFNDTYGHDIGDQVLKLVAAKIGSVKGGGRAFRYGGEEFTIVFPRKNIEQALPELEAVRRAIEEYKIVIRHPQRKTKQDRATKKGNDFKTVSVTISIGAAIRENKQSFEQALKCSDQALYKAKKKGRNNVSY